VRNSDRIIDYRAVDVNVGSGADGEGEDGGAGRGDREGGDSGKKPVKSEEPVKAAKPWWRRRKPMNRWSRRGRLRRRSRHAPPRW
jgi:hypothetical protein